MGEEITASLISIRQRPNESLRNFLSRFCNAIAEILNLIEQLAINYLAVGINKSRDTTLLEEFFEKNPQTLQATFQIVKHRMTLQKVVGSIRSPRCSSQRYDCNKTHSPHSVNIDTGRDVRYSPHYRDKSYSSRSFSDRR